MNDDQLRQPQDTRDTADAQDSSEGNNGTHDMYRMDDMGNAGSAESSDIEAPAMSRNGESTGEETTGEADSGEAATMSSDAHAAEDEQTSTGEDTSDMSATPDISMDMAADESTYSVSVPGMTEVSDASDAPMDMAVDASTGYTDMEAPEAPQTSGNETPDERPGRPPRPQYPSDEAPSDEMVIHTARDPRMDEIASNASMEDLMKASERQYRPIKHGDVIEGTVMKVGRDEIMIDIGGKTEGVISSRESTSLSEEEREALQIGDTLLVSVVQPHNSEGQAVLSLDRARQEKAWRDLQRAFEAGETISAPVVGHNKGGILVNIEGIRGFVPSSQVSSLPPGEANKQAEMARLHNQSIPLKIIEINRHRNRLILSERQAMQEQRESMRARLLLELQSGQIRPGTVTSVCDFGAFVDIGGADGLIHLSELSWKRVSHPSEVLKVGDRVNVYVLSVDQHERKIALSLKRTQPEPWETITDQYQLGQLVKGTITQITTFGAFARLEDGIEGLIHVSELAEGRVAHPRNVVKEGEQLELKVIRIDPARKRIGLSLKRVNEDANRAAEGAEGEAPEMSGSGDAGMEGQPSPMPQQSYESEPPRQEPRQQEQRSPRQAPQGQGQGQQRGQQGQRPPRPQQQPQQPLTSQSEDFEHLGALAQALAAHTQQAATPSEDEGGMREATTPPTAPAEESDPGEVVGSLSGVNTSADMDATSAMGDAGEADTSDTGSGDDMTEQAGGADSLPGDKSDTTATAPEMGAFGAEEPDSTTDEATDSGDMPSEDEQGNTGDTSADATEEADATSGDESADTSAETDTSSGDEADEESTDTDAGDGDEPQAMMPSAADASDTETGDTGGEEDTDAAEEETSTSDTDAATDSGDMPAEESEASMPAGESMESEDSTDTESEVSSEEADADNASQSDASAEGEDTSSTSDSGDDAGSGAPSGSEGAPSTADSDDSGEDNEGKDEKVQG
ncbi:MAG TPA: 30S ribosomal protein S1 [Chloroflexia bacterium]|nr:30S ribosomal protein S1 [Chloroflexia bacterium]